MGRSRDLGKFITDRERLVRLVAEQMPSLARGEIRRAVKVIFGRMFEALVRGDKIYIEDYFSLRVWSGVRPRENPKEKFFITSPFGKTLDRLSLTHTPGDRWHPDLNHDLNPDPRSCEEPPVEPRRGANPKAPDWRDSSTWL